MNKKVHLDKTVENFIDSLKIDKPLYEMTPDEARKFLTEVQESGFKDLEASVEDISIFSDIAGEISIRVVKPESLKNETLPLVVYCHGGGWVMGDADIFDMTIKTIAENTKSAVAFINYSRSPEFKYPAALNQICEAIKYFSENGSDYKIDSNRIAVAGDSAGGNMAAAAAIELKESIKLCFMALMYPVCDADMKTDSYKEFKDGPWLSKKAMEYFVDAYLNSKDEKNDIYVSLLKAEKENLEGLAPTLIITAENDILRDEGEMFARKLIEAGVDTACVRINNTIHDFIMLNSLRESNATHAAFKLVCSFLKHALHK